MKIELIVWALGINGEGSSLVSKNIINSVLKLNKMKNIKIIISNNSLLKKYIFKKKKTKINPKNFIILPRFFRNYFIQASIKLFIPMFFISKYLIVLDDFPVVFHKKQVLYFQQAGIIHGKSLNWTLRRIFFRILISRRLFIYTQTNHVRKSLIKKFNLSENQLITKLHNI